MEKDLFFEKRISCKISMLNKIWNKICLVGNFLIILERKDVV